MEDLLTELEIRMEEAFQALLRNFSKTRTGRANTAALEHVKIDYYGEQTPIKQLCNISIPEPRLIVIQPWDKTIMDLIEKSILASNIGVTPENDGNVVRLPFQPLTEDTRKDIHRFPQCRHNRGRHYRTGRELSGNNKPERRHLVDLSRKAKDIR